MFQQLTSLISTIVTFLLVTTLILFGTIYMVGSQDESLDCATPDTLIDDFPKVELTELEMYGESLFKSNCAACHKVYKNAVGPALHNVSEKYESEWLYSWIKNSAALIKSGDARAVSIYNEYGRSNMNAFPQLSHDDIDAILAYTSMAKY